MVQRFAFFAIAAISLAPSLALAGPVQRRHRRDAGANRLGPGSRRGEGKTGDQTAAATDHRQPTAASIAAAEARLGEGHFVGKALAALDVARKADAQGDAAACHAAVAEAEKDLGAKASP